MVSFLCMYEFDGLLPTSGENFTSIVPLEIYLVRRLVTRSIIISPTVSSTVPGKSWWNTRNVIDHLKVWYDPHLNHNVITKYAANHSKCRLEKKEVNLWAESKGLRCFSGVKDENRSVTWYTSFPKSSIVWEPLLWLRLTKSRWKRSISK